MSGTPTVREIIDLLELTLKDAVQITEIPVQMKRNVVKRSFTT